MIEETLLKDDNVQELNLFEEEFFLFSEEGRKKPKLFYLTQDFIGNKETVENKESLVELITSLVELEIQDKNNSVFLLVSEACKTLSKKSKLFKVWQKALENNIVLYVDENAYFSLLGTVGAGRAKVGESQEEYRSNSENIDSLGKFVHLENKRKLKCENLPSYNSKNVVDGAKPILLKMSEIATLMYTHELINIC